MVTHVVIVGAGPAGAALSYLLARRGIKVTLLERQLDFAREFRGEGLMPSGIDALRQMELLPALDALPQRPIDLIELYLKQKHLFSVDLASEGIVGSSPRVVSQQAMLEMLVAEARRFPCFRIDYGARVTGLITENGRVAGVKLLSSREEIALRGDFVIGADGRHSIVRQRSSLPGEDIPQAFDVIWCKVSFPDFLANRDVIRFYMGDGAGAVMFPSYDHRLQVGWLVEKGSFRGMRGQEAAAWVEELSRHVSPDLRQHLLEHGQDIVRPFLLHVVACRLRRWSAPGLLLVGDAAHPMSPIGAQGINIALRDAVVAANHLLPALEGGHPASDLDAAALRFQAERRPEIERIQRMQEVPSRLLFRPARWRRLVLCSLPFLARTGIPQCAYRFAVRCMANGVTRVRLEA